MPVQEHEAGGLEAPRRQKQQRTFDDGGGEVAGRSGEVAGRNREIARTGSGEAPDEDEEEPSVAFTESTGDAL